MDKTGTSPSKCPQCDASSIPAPKDCTAMIAPCTTLYHTVNQIRLMCFIGSRDALSSNTPSVA
jgi:hypothetical protein